MATRRGPRFKECRRFGINVCGHPKALERMGSITKRGKKISEYGKQLLEKQKIKAYYGIFERQLLRYYNAASKSKERTADALFKTLECRLDNLVYRIGFANSIRLARQQVTHRHILVNGKNINIPSYICKAGDVITLKESSRQNEHFRINMQELGGFVLPYISQDKENFQGILERLPLREEIPIQIEDQLIVEYFSR